MVVYGMSGGISCAGLKPSPCYPGCFCERFHPGAIVQPFSSYSNLWYVLVGWGVIAVAKLPISRDESLINLIARVPSYSYTFGIVAIVVGLASFFYDVSLMLLGRWADYMVMYMFASFIVIYDLTRLRVLHGIGFPIGYAVLNIALAIPMISISNLAVATGCNLVDERGTLCNPASLWQWHAVWYFLTAVAIGLIYLYFRSEDEWTRDPVH